MRTITVNVPLAVNAAELATARAEEAKAEEERQRTALAQRNRDAGKPAPTPGSTLYVSTTRGLPVRGRAGVTFTPAPIEVKVEAGTDEEIAAKAKSTPTVSVHGAEQILEDSNGPGAGLIVYSSKPAASQDLGDMTDEQLEAEVQRRKSAPRPGAPDRIVSSRKAEPPPKAPEHR